MDALLNKLKDWKKIIYFCVCGLFVFLLLVNFIQNVDNDAGAITVIVDLLQYVFEGAILAAGLYGLLTGKEAFCKVAFALLLGAGLYTLIAGVFNGMWAFEYFEYYRASQIIYYVFSFITGLFGTAFAVLVVLGWLLGRDDLKKIGGYLGVCYVGMLILMIIFSIVMVADKVANWTMIVNAIYSVFLRAFEVVLATTGILAFEECAACAAPAAKKEAPAKETAAPAEEEKPAEATED